MEKFESFLDFIMGIYNSIKDTEWEGYSQYILIFMFIMMVMGYKIGRASCRERV